jgi:hypothetical protein
MSATGSLGEMGVSMFGALCHELMSNDKYYVNNR